MARRFSPGSVHISTSICGRVLIPDSPAPGVSSTINVADPRTVQDVNVTANLTHSYDGDLLLELISPASTTITLSNRHGGSGDNFTNTIFDDEAATAIASGIAPYTGSFKPDTPLSAVDLVPGTGAWKLKVTDLAGVDTGTINSWTLTLTYPGSCAPSGAPPPVPDGTIGAVMLASRMNPGGSSLHLTWDVAACAAKNYHLLYGPLATVSSYALSGAACGAGPLGSFTWNGVPAGNLWYVLVGDDGSGVEGSWGKSSAGAERGGTSASGQCGFNSRTNAGTCP